jgi:hypothetical protein
VAIIISEREREGKPESIVSPEEPSHATTMCLKIDAACTLWLMVGTVSGLTRVLSSGQALTFFMTEDMQIAPCT